MCFSYALESYRRAAATAKAGGFAAEMTPVELVTKKGAPPTVINADEEVGKLKADKVPVRDTGLPAPPRRRRWSEPPESLASSPVTLFLSLFLEKKFLDIAHTFSQL